MSSVSGTSGMWPCSWISKASKDRVLDHLFGSWVLSQSWATLTGTGPIPAFPCHSCGLLPLQGPWLSTPPPHPAGQQSHPSGLLPSAPSGPSWAPQCLSPVQRSEVGCCGVPETLVLCKQEQKDYLYFNPISSEPTNICHTR